MAHEFTQEVEVKERNLTAHYTVAPAEPDVGIMGDYVDDIWLVNSSGERAAFTECHMTDADWDNLTATVMENHE